MMQLSKTQLIGTILTFDKQVEELPGIVSFHFKPRSGLEWKAGQYFVYFMPGAAFDYLLPFLRPFTISLAPSEGHLRITTRIREKPSIFKRELLKLKPGARVIGGGPYGFFTLTDTSKDYVFLAGGIGITAFRSILVDLAARGTMPRITLLYSNRETTVLFRQELDALAQKFPSLAVHYLTDPERIEPATVKRLVPEYTKPTYYISGPKPMVLGVSKQLQQELGISKSQIEHDAFDGYPWPLTKLAG